MLQNPNAIEFFLKKSLCLKYTCTYDVWCVGLVVVFGGAGCELCGVYWRLLWCVLLCGVLLSPLSFSSAPLLRFAAAAA
jgi:hypothetical protein